MTNYPESGIKLIADTDSYTTAMEEAIQLAEYFDSIGDLSIEVTADVAQFESAIEDLPLDGETVDYTIDASVDGIDDLPLDGESVDFTVQADVTGDLAELPVDGETIDTELNVEETDTAKETLSAVETIKNLKILETVWNIAGTAVDLFKNFAGQVITPMLDLDDAVARVNATTGNAIPNARTLIKDIFYDDLGDSIDQVASLITIAEQMKLPIEEATRSALTFTHTWQEENPEEVIKTLNALVSTGLAKSFTDAGDLLAVAFQNGANKGGDLLRSVEENAVAIQGLGLSGQEAFSLIKTGLDNGFTSADQVLKTLEKIKQNVTNAAGNSTSDVSQTLKTLGIANPAETGDAWSADFFKSVIDGIKNAPGLTDTEKEAMFTSLVGGKMGGKTFSAFLQLSPEDADNVFANMAGASERAATAVDDSLRGAIDDFMLAANKAAQDFFSSDQIDLPGKIAALKEGLQAGLDVLSNEGSLGEALTVALKPIGFDDEFQGLEAALGDFVIGILQAVSAIQSLNPDSWAAKAGTDATIAKMAETQLTFNLKVGNPDDVSSEIAIAVSRGVSPEKITSAVGGAISELVADGSDAALAKAQALIDTLNKPVDMNKVPLLANGTPMNVEPVVTPDGLAKFQTQVDAAQPVTVNVIPSTDSTDKFLDTILPVTTETKALATNADAAGTAVQVQNEATVAQTEATDASTASTTAQTTVTTAQTTAQTAQNTATTAAVTPIKKIAESTKAYASAADAAAGSADAAAGGISNSAYQMMAIANIAPAAADGLSGVAAALQIILDKAHAVGVAADNLAKQPKTGGTTGGTTTNVPGGGAASGYPNAMGTFMVGEDGPEIVSSNKGVSVLNNMTTEKIMAALNGYTPGGSFSANGGSMNVINNNNYVPSQAVADSLGYSQAKILRGQG